MDTKAVARIYILPELEKMYDELSKIRQVYKDLPHGTRICELATEIEDKIFKLQDKILETEGLK